MNKLLCFLTLLTCSLLCCGQGVVKSVYVERNASGNERYAAAQLMEFLHKGGISTDTVVKKNGTIYVGNTPYLRKHYAAYMDSLHDDGHLICGDGKNLCLYGKGNKGTLYAVYAFLEMQGYRLYTPNALVIPDFYILRLPQCHIVSNPAFAYREVSYYYPNHSQLYADWHHLHTQADRNKMFSMFVHTFNKLLPPKDYFDTHPEWYSLNNGHRSRDGQLCLSNPEMLDKLCTNLSIQMIATPPHDIWSVSPNDNYNVCECDNCRRLDSIYGGPSGTLLWFVNQVARRFPDNTIATLAYQYTRKAPTSDIRPDSNVLIMLCPIEVGREKPIATSDFTNDMEDWTQLTDNIFIWDYVVQFRNFWDPFPNLHVLQPNLQYFRDHGVRMMFEQASGVDNITSWMDIRCYMIAKLLWNPDADMDSIMADFYQSYYGDAGKYMKSIIDTMTAALIQSGQRLDIYGYPIDAADGYLSPERRRQYWQLMTNGWNAIRDDAVDDRFYYFYASLLFAGVELAIQEGSANNEEIRSWLDILTNMLHKFNVPQMMEMGISPDEYRKTINNYIKKRDSGNKAQHKNVTLRHPASVPYNNAGLTDAEAGIMDYRHSWLGFWGDTLDATIEFGEPIIVNEISMDFFFYPLSWILLPERIEYQGSTDGNNWKTLEVFSPENPEILARPDIKEFKYILTQSNKNEQYRFIRVVAIPPKEIPAWHRAAGQKAWIFTDEIIVR